MVVEEVAPLRPTSSSPNIGGISIGGSVQKDHDHQMMEWRIVKLCMVHGQPINNWVFILLPLQGEEAPRSYSRCEFSRAEDQINTSSSSPGQPGTVGCKGDPLNRHSSVTWSPPLLLQLITMQLLLLPVDSSLGDLSIRQWRPSASERIINLVNKISSGRPAGGFGRGASDLHLANESPPVIMSCVCM